MQVIMVSVLSVQKRYCNRLLLNTLASAKNARVWLTVGNIYRSHKTESLSFERSIHSLVPVDLGTTVGCTPVSRLIYAANYTKAC